MLVLLRENPVYEAIPTERCRHAGINRNTFYSHSASLESLPERMEEELDFHAQIRWISLPQNKAHPFY